MTPRRLLPFFALFALVAVPGVGFAQSAGPEEAVQADGAISQTMALTPAQERAIYNAVIQQRGRRSNPSVPIAIGAAVPEAAELRELPAGAAANTPLADVLKYAMVENNVVVIDPIGMRVIDVIHDNALP